MYPDLQQIPRGGTGPVEARVGGPGEYEEADGDEPATPHHGDEAGLCRWLAVVFVDDGGEVLRLRGTLASREAEWDVMTDLYFYRDPEAEENKDATGEDEAKVPGVDEVGPGAVESGFNNEWEVSGAGAGAFAAASGTAGAPATSTWDAEGADWAAAEAPAQTGNQGWSEQAGAPAAPETSW
ncbi:hypothetical protein B0A55_10941 [Friedmanniomyces simplex]|uniref:Small ribosomal subunit protein uS2 C-terminal domain-containing protein n=1 Tax=Friedmanniomyces simplex TaxID=329884 RepID=A0A4U0WP79_9PEZI|nr:hypothetical protein B0A55_10941 [Friedmanniomyces simplex]